MTDRGSRPEDRYARALRAFEDYRERQADGTAEPVADFLAAHEDLREILEALLAEGIDERIASGVEPEPDAPAQVARAPRPERIGPYRILEELGEGGMGTVYLAEQREPIKRRVALKLIKLGMDSKAVVARFGQERQALALMQHDGIAKVYDCGTTDRGQPYFVMEYVKGVPLNAFCDRNSVPLAARIELMQQVCAAVTHAHQKGVVHRDLKPGNVLVTEDAGRVQIKIIDFGLAKAMGQKLVEATLFTEAGQIVGTPEYMAPEQADPTNQDIDTRADVYSLGVMLYELLVGSLPFPQHELRAAGMLEVQRILREVEPQKPSTRLSSNANVAGDVALARRIALGTLQKALRTDLDWLVLKALEKDRARRYDTANALAADLQRYLDHEPLEAGPPSAGYRLKKLLRRYRGQVIAATLVFVALVAGGIGTALGYAEASQRAEENAELAASESKAKAAAERTLADFRLLSNVVQLQDAKRIEAGLYPAFPDQAPAMRDWLRDFGEPLAQRLPLLEQALNELRTKALPQTQAQRLAERESHPQHGELRQLQEQVRCWERTQAVRSGKAKPEVPTLDAATQQKTAQELNQVAWPLVDPDKPVYGQELQGLAMAQLALQKIDGGDTSIARHMLLDTLAWACHRNGLDDEALAHSRAAHAGCTAAEKDEYAGLSEKLEQAIAAWRGAGGEERMATLRARITAVDAAVSARQSYEFADGGERFLHQTLARLVQELRAFVGDKGEFSAVRARLRDAESVQATSIDAHRDLWDAAIATIAAAPQYGGFQLTPQLGLVPIGADPASGLWEFVHLASGTEGRQFPERDAATKRLVPTGDMGIVFVLLPGGTFTMGAQKTDPNGPNFDPQALQDATPHEVTLAPFFLAKYELTQGQWSRLGSGDESLRQPSQHKAGATNFVGGKITLADPVEQVDWSMCEGLLRRHGLVLPTEAQWEYGCRAGTTTPWSCAAADLVRYGNVADASAKRAAPQWSAFEDWDDRHAVHAPVGSFLPNAFGLHDVHGNVWEWCLDEYGSYSGAVRAGDGLRLQGSGSANRVHRGGSFGDTAALARSSYRGGNAASIRIITLGLRPARTSRL